MKTTIFRILGIAAVASIGMTACVTDACKDVDCGLNGECVDGDCVCEDGYEGADCSTLWREGMTGTVNLSGTISCGVTGNGNFPSTATTVSNGSSDLKIVVNIGGAIALTCTMTSTNTFSVDSQSVNGYDYTGSGTLNGSVFSLTLNEYDDSVPETCIYTLTGTL